MNNDMKFEVTAIIGESQNGLSRVNITKPAFNAIRQSNWAEYNNKENGLFGKDRIEPELSFTPRRAFGGIWVNEFILMGVKLLSYSSKENKSMYIFMDTEKAKDLLVTDLAFDISKFDLSNAIAA